jgi:hypothetical protein
MFFNLNGEIRIFQDKDKVKQIMLTKPASQKILKGIIHIEEKEKQSQI